MPVTLQMNSAMQELTQTSFQTSEQHKEVGKTRSARDCKDMHTIINYMRERNPFAQEDKSPCNIDSDLVADSSLHVDTAKNIGEIF